MPEDFQEDAIGRVIVGMMTGIDDLHEATAGQDVVRPTAVLYRKHGVSITPDDEDTLGAHPGEAVDRLDALALRPDDSTHRGHEARETALLLETLQFGEGSFAHSAMPEADLAQSGQRPGQGADHAPTDSGTKHQLRSRQTRGPQAKVDIRAESSAGHEDERSHPRGELVGELQAYAAAVGMPDEVHAVDLERVEQIANRGCAGPEAEIAIARVGGSVADEVDGDDVTPRGSKESPTSPQESTLEPTTWTRTTGIPLPGDSA